VPDFNKYLLLNARRTAGKSLVLRSQGAQGGGHGLTIQKKDEYTGWCRLFQKDLFFCEAGVFNHLFLD